uniref:ABC transporter domain-containing protein n=1 Tax=Haemonchus contortus TaxID=6289 RepID=A0A7I4YAS1_HAECO
MGTELLPSKLYLSWYNVNAYVQQTSRPSKFWFTSKSSAHQRSSSRMVLDNVYGMATPGEIMAIMGSSGAGKTTLLNVLAHRNLGSLQFQGSVQVNQQPVTKEFMRTACAYVQQDDCFIGSLTVKEHLMFHAALRMGGGYHKSHHLQKVEEIIQELGLNDCADSIIGTLSSEGISAGEKKRVAFASEIVTNPPILFCDEPTSGLDSFLAVQVVNVLKKLAIMKSMTIVFTIHQPSSQVYEFFDRIYMMSEGRVAFCGPQERAVRFWTEIGQPLPRNFNPADHYISTLSATEQWRSEHRIGNATAICEAFNKSAHGLVAWMEATSFARDAIDHNTAGSSRPRVERASTKFGHQHNRFRATCFNQFRALFWRNTKTILREPTLLRVQLLQSVVIAALTGIVYLGDSYTVDKVANINGSLYQLVMNMAFMFQFVVVDHFCSEIDTFYREYTSGLYSVLAYFLAKNLAELPAFTLSAVIFGTILYWMSRLIPLWEAFAFYLLIAVLVQNTAISIAYAMGCVFGSVSVAIAVLPIFVVPMMAFGGYFINQSSLPFYFYPFKYLSYFGYAFESLTVNEWSHVNSITGCEKPGAMGCYRNGSDVIQSLSFSPQNKWLNAVLILIMILAFRLIAFVSLWARARSRK